MLLVVNYISQIKVKGTFRADSFLAPINREDIIVHI